MNIFRFIADMLHLAAILILLYRIKKSRNCIGKSILNQLEKSYQIEDKNSFNSFKQ